MSDKESVHQTEPRVCAECHHPSSWLENGVCHAPMPVHWGRKLCGHRCQLSSEPLEELAKGFAGVRRRASDFAAARKDSAAADQYVAPPRIWLQSRECNNASDYCSDALVFSEEPRGTSDEYLVADPIRKAIEVIEVYNDALEGEKIMLVSVSDWEALVALIKGEK